MKRALLVLALTALLVMAAHSMALGAIHHFTNEISGGGLALTSTDTWFDLAKEAPKSFVGGYLESGYNELGAMYFLGDQTFVQAVFAGDHSLIQGSYLFNNNFFAGLSFSTDSSDGEYVFGTLGYRFDFGEDDYIALSAEYLFVDDEDDMDGMKGYDVDLKFYGDNWKVFGELFLDELNDATRFTGGYNYGVSDSFVLGIILGFAQMGPLDASIVGAGFTWSPEQWIFDAQFISFEAGSTNNSSTDVSAMYQANDKLWIGLEAWSYSDEDLVSFAVKAKYFFASGILKAAFWLPNDDNDAAIGIAYEMKLK